MIFHDRGNPVYEGDRKVAKNRTVIESSNHPKSSSQTSSVAAFLALFEQCVAYLNTAEKTTATRFCEKSKILKNGLHSNDIKTTMKRYTNYSSLNRALR